MHIYRFITCLHNLFLFTDCKTPLSGTGTTLIDVNKNIEAASGNKADLFTSIVYYVHHSVNYRQILYILTVILIRISLQRFPLKKMIM